MEIRLLGPPEVFFESRPLKFATRKALGVFSYLVTEARSHSREKLVDMFWPESESHLGHSALRNTLARIKESLRCLDDPLRMEAGRVGFNYLSAHNLDLKLVTRVLGDTQPIRIAPAMVPLLETAVESARGPFMDGFSLPDAPAFEDWLRFQRSHWGYRQNLIYDRLSLYQLENNLIQPAIETVFRWLNLDRLNETAYQRLMLLQRRNGDSSGALKTYETCKAVLNQELGIKPSSETEAVLALIRSNR